MHAPISSEPGGSPAQAAPAEGRRGFFASAIAIVLGAVAYLTPAAVSVVSFLNPLRQKSQAGEFVRLASLADLDETPRKFSVIADRQDAWNRFPKEPVGAVYLRRLPGDQVEAIHVICPHAGCSVSLAEYEDPSTKQKHKKFACPCHNASFDLSGKRLDAVSPSPRDLDTLEVEVRNGEVLVRFQNFRTGTPAKVAEA
jgi:Rieske Fe-S protein